MRSLIFTVRTALLASGGLLLAAPVAAEPAPPYAALLREAQATAPRLIESGARGAMPRRGRAGLFAVALARVEAGGYINAFPPGKPPSIRRSWRDSRDGGEGWRAR